MKIMDEFELEGGIAIENYPLLCRDIMPGDILSGIPRTEGIEFSLNGNVLGYLTGDYVLIPSYAYNNGYDIFAKIIAVRRVEEVPVLFASLHLIHRGNIWGREKDKIENE